MPVCLRWICQTQFSYQVYFAKTLQQIAASATVQPHNTYKIFSYWIKIRLLFIDTTTNISLKSQITLSNKVNVIPWTAFWILQMIMAVATDAAQHQYIDLGDMSEACITIPDTCAAGAAVAFWMRINKTECVNPKGIMSSRQRGSKTGFEVLCEADQKIKLVGATFL